MTFRGPRNGTGRGVDVDVATALETIRLLRTPWPVRFASRTGRARLVELRA
jgi:hypothetical protein